MRHIMVISEFVVDSIGDDAIKVHGKKTGNTFYFRKLETSPEEYINKVLEMEDNFIVSGLEGTVGVKKSWVNLIWITISC